jgi:hypothetical protein
MNGKVTTQKIDRSDIYDIGFDKDKNFVLISTKFLIDDDM